MVLVCISVLAKKTLFLPPSRLFAYLDFCVLKKKKINFNFDYLPPDPVQLVWEGSGNQ